MLGNTTKNVDDIKVLRKRVLKRDDKDYTGNTILRPYGSVTPTLCR